MRYARRESFCAYRIHEAGVVWSQNEALQGCAGCRGGSARAASVVAPLGVALAPGADPRGDGVADAELPLEPGFLVVPELRALSPRAQAVPERGPLPLHGGTRDRLGLSLLAMDGARRARRPPGGPRRRGG